jgi:hypothetical protein
MDDFTRPKPNSTLPIVIGQIDKLSRVKIATTGQLHIVSLFDLRNRLRYCRQLCQITESIG